MKYIIIAFTVLSVFYNNDTKAQKADIIITNANIITAVHKGERKQAMAITAGKIAFVGTNKEVLNFQSTTSTIIDAKGATIVPGLNDVHLHPNPETPFTQVDHTLRYMYGTMDGDNTLAVVD